MLPPVHAKERRRRAGGEEGEDLRILHPPDLLGREERAEAAELAVGDASTVRPSTAGDGGQDLFCCAEALGEVLLGREIFAAGVDVDGAVAEDGAGLLAVGGAELGEGLDEDGAGDPAGTQGDQKVRGTGKRRAARFVEDRIAVSPQHKLILLS